jgi:indole-3-glycerol phosphate synthase
MSSRLEAILNSTRIRVDRDRSATGRQALEKRASEHTPRGFRRALRERSQTQSAVIAELKRASPSKGLIRGDFPVSQLAHELAHAGATCLSVLTEPEYFQGSLANLETASHATSLPCLRKDFVVDEYQIIEARAHRADAILLIVAALTDAELRNFNTFARQLELDVLVEVHNAEELDRALQSGCTELIGVNNRNLHTFEVSLETSLDLIQCMPADSVRIAESGIDSSSSIARLREAGFDGFLIGESLMRAERPGDALRALLESKQAVRAV